MPAVRDFIGNSEMLANITGHRKALANHPCSRLPQLLNTILITQLKAHYPAYQRVNAPAVVARLLAQAQRIGLIQSL
jgi:hypothetical protein